MKTEPQRKGVMPRVGESRTGYSLVELAVASGVGLIVLLGVVAAVALHARTCAGQNLVRDLQQNVRFALDSVSRDLRVAGYGLRVRNSELGLWLPWVSGITNNATVVEGASANHPDTLHIAAAFDPPVASLSVAATNGAALLNLGPGEGSRFNTTNRCVIYVGRTETARIVSVSGDQITISTHPTLSGRGLKEAYQAGAPVELVSIVTYAWRSATNAYPYQAYLSRDDHMRSFAQPWHTMMAGHIEDFQVVQQPYSTRVRIRGRTPEPMPHQRDPSTGDRYRRLTLETEVISRNSFRRRY